MYSNDQPRWWMRAGPRKRGHVEDLERERKRERDGVFIQISMSLVCFFLSLVSHARGRQNVKAARMQWLIAATTILLVAPQCSAVRWGHRREILQDFSTEVTPNASWGFCAVEVTNNRSTEVHLNIFGAWVKSRGLGSRAPQDFSVDPFPLFINEKLTRNFVSNADRFGANGDNLAVDLLSDDGGISLAFWAFSGNSSIGMNTTLRVDQSGQPFQEDLEFQLASTDDDAVTFAYEGRSAEGDIVRRTFECDQVSASLSDGGWHFFVWRFQIVAEDTIENSLTVNNQLTCTSVHNDDSSLFQILSQGYTDPKGQMAVQIDSRGIDGMTIYNYKLSDSQYTDLFECSAILSVTSNDTATSLPEFYSVVEQEPFPEATEFEDINNENQGSFAIQVLNAFIDPSNRAQMIGFSFMSVVFGGLLALGIKKFQDHRQRKANAKKAQPVDEDLEETRWSKLTDSADSLENDLDELSDIDANDGEEVINPISDYHMAEEGESECHTERNREGVKSDANQTI